MGQGVGYQQDNIKINLCAVVIELMLCRDHFHFRRCLERNEKIFNENFARFWFRQTEEYGKRHG